MDDNQKKRLEDLRKKQESGQTLNEDEQKEFETLEEKESDEE